eukprot:Rmarinus@m.11456
MEMVLRSNILADPSEEVVCARSRSLGLRSVRPGSRWVCRKKTAPSGSGRFGCVRTSRRQNSTTSTSGQPTASLRNACAKWLRRIGVIQWSELFSTFSTGRSNFKLPRLRPQLLRTCVWWARQPLLPRYPTRTGPLPSRKSLIGGLSLPPPGCFC